MIPLPHQVKAVSDVQIAIGEGVRRICVTAPTGAGKSLIMAMLIEEWLTHGLRVILYTNRKMLVDQLSRTLTEHGLDHGIRAAGTETNNEAMLQVSSIATENARVLKSKVWNLFPADRVLIDEAHIQTGDVMCEMMTGHVGAGAFIVGMTATPIDLGPLYDKLICAGLNSELRASGLLILSHHYGPDEPDMKAIKRKQDSTDELTEPQVRKLMGAVLPDGSASGQLQCLYGRVWKWFEKLNPDHKPSILFAPGVQESLWFAEQFTKKGVKAAHLDGKDVWVDGEFHRTSKDIREQVMKASKDGRIQVLCNRFVLREGVDAPWLAHGIFATVFGSVQSYLQSGGRLLRSHPSLESVTIQDHGGNWWRWGSLNSDRKWVLDGRANAIAGMRADALRAKPICDDCRTFGPSKNCLKCAALNPEPARCPGCAKIVGRMIPGTHCEFCDFEFQSVHRSRPVVTIDGDLHEHAGNIFNPRTICKRSDAAEQWERTYWASFPPKSPPPDRARFKDEKTYLAALAKYEKRKKGRSFKQAEAAFASNNNWQWPSHDLPLMPINPFDWYKLVHEVPRNRLKS